IRQSSDGMAGSFHTGESDLGLPAPGRPADCHRTASMLSSRSLPLDQTDHFGRTRRPERPMYLALFPRTHSMPLWPEEPPMGRHLGWASDRSPTSRHSQALSTAIPARAEVLV